MPEASGTNRKIDPDTAARLLVERGDLKVVDGVMRATGDVNALDFNVWVGPKLVRGAAVGVGVAGTLYDGYETGKGVGYAKSQNNQTASQSHLMHFGARNVGGWGGAGIVTNERDS